MFHVKYEEAPVERIERQARVWGVEVSPSQVRELVGFGRFLAGYDKANVIGARTLDEVIDEHVLDSLSCLLFEPLGGLASIVDVGSGGGLPGLPLGIALKSVDLALVESTSKKVEFLREAAEDLGLANFRILDLRAEEVGGNVEYRESFDAATARALAPMDVLLEYCLPLVSVGGHVIAMKGRVEEEELERGESAAKILGGREAQVIRVPRLPEFEEKQRHLVVVEKVSPTPEGYPRRIGTPSKKPLGKFGNR